MDKSITKTQKTQAENVKRAETAGAQLPGRAGKRPEERKFLKQAENNKRNEGRK
jgi:hypothetical protein